MIPAPTFCTCPPLTTGVGNRIARTERWEHQRTCPVRHPLTTADRIASDRANRGLPRTDPRDVLIALAISAGYSFTQMVEQLRSGMGDERTDLPGGGERVAINRGRLRAALGDDGKPCEPGGETLLDRAMRDA